MARVRGADIKCVYIHLLAGVKFNLSPNQQHETFTASLIDGDFFLPSFLYSFHGNALRTGTTIYTTRMPSYTVPACSLLWTFRHPTSLWSDFVPFFCVIAPCGNFSLFSCFPGAHRRGDGGKHHELRDKFQKWRNNVTQACKTYVQAVGVVARLRAGGSMSGTGKRFLNYFVVWIITRRKVV